MHPACWQIFLQVHALLAPCNPLRPNLRRLGHVFAHSDLEESGRGLIPDWAGNYAGPEQFWDDGWTWTEDVDASVVAGLLEEKPEWDFLVSDPDMPRYFNQQIQHPPEIHPTTLSPTPLRPSVGAHDNFSRLPEELLLEIICFLPTASIQNARLASKVMASVQLGTSFWRSRFEYPNELCHIQVPAKFLRTSRADTSIIDWRELCNKLLHPQNGRYSDSWKNRKRIRDLNSKLVQMLLSEDSEPGQMDTMDDLA